jgi:hypothetical protein
LGGEEEIDRSAHGSMTEVEGAEEGGVEYEMTREDWERRKAHFNCSGDASQGCGCSSSV